MSFFGGALVALPAAVPGVGAALGTFLTSMGFGTAFELGACVVSGDAESKPMFGKGATGLLTGFPGGAGPGRPVEGSLVTIFGDSKFTVIGAGGATGFCSGGGWRSALSWLRSRKMTALARSFALSASTRRFLQHLRGTHDVTFQIIQDRVELVNGSGDSRLECCRGVAYALPAISLGGPEGFGSRDNLGTTWLVR